MGLLAAQKRWRARKGEWIFKTLSLPTPHALGRAQADGWEITGTFPVLIKGTTLGVGYSLRKRNPDAEPQEENA